MLKEILQRISFIVIMIVAISLFSTTIVKAENEIEEDAESTVEETVESNIDGENKEETPNVETTDMPNTLGETPLEATEEAEATYSDFSSAKYKLETMENGSGFSKLTISSINFVTDMTTTLESSHFCGLITSTKTTPTIEEIKDVTDGQAFSLSYDKDSKSLVFSSRKISSSIELNQDMYLWIVESYSDGLNYNEKIVVNGEKLTRPEYPKYAGIFTSYTHVTYDSTLMSFNIPWGNKTTRKFTVKIGQVKDNTILNDLKNNKSDSFANLLKYAKSAKSIYNRNFSTFEAGTPSYVVSSSNNSNKSRVDLTGKLTNEEYYYMYVVFDDENGKYYPVEGVTLAQASIPINWYLFFLGSDDFNWKDFDTTDTKKVSTNENTVVKVTPETLPYTGTIVFPVIAVIIMTIVLVYFKYKNDEYKGI